MKAVGKEDPMDKTKTTDPKTEKLCRRFISSTEAFSPPSLPFHIRRCISWTFVPCFGFQIVQGTPLGLAPFLSRRYSCEDGEGETNGGDCLGLSVKFQRKMVWWMLLGRTRVSGVLYGHQRGFIYQQKCSLVNVKLKWVKDRALDAIVASEGHLKATCILVSIISSSPRGCVPIYRLSRHRRQLGLPHDMKPATFMRRFPNIFYEFHVLDSGGTGVPWFRLTSEAQNLHQEALDSLCQNEMDLLNRLRKLLMLTCDRMLPLQTIDQLKWDLGLPDDLHDLCYSLVPRYPELFSVVQLPDDRAGLKLISWDDNHAVPQLQKNDAFNQGEGDVKNGSLAFPIGFTRGFGLKRKCMKWLEEWQRLPYTSPYADASHLDPCTDISEKRIVGVFYELLHLTLQKKTERKNVSNLRKPLSCPQKFTKVFERHPGIFYISRTCDT